MAGTPDRRSRLARRSATSTLGLCVLLGLSVSCAPEAEKPPSVLLVVFDTLRADAVSFYGKVHGTTPNLDVLARQGLAYTRAYSSAPWTIPSHATLFTGLGVEEHQVGIGKHSLLPEELETLAEKFSKAGYETVSISESAFISEWFQLVQGFQRHRATRIDELTSLAVFEPARPAQFAIKEINPVAEVQEWLLARTSERPFFLFVNLIDAHDPYEIREENPFVDAAVSDAEIRQHPTVPGGLLCGGIPTPEQIEVMRGLYLGGVAEADFKLGRIFERLRRAGLTENLVTVVTSDHGEHFGEHRLMGHEFSVRDTLLHVPLVVHGLPGVEPAIIDEPVALLDVAPSILSWANQEVSPDLPGYLLPEAPRADAPERSLFAAYNDQYLNTRDEMGGLPPRDKDQKRLHCGSGDPVFGSMAALTRYPFKLLWFDEYPLELYDLSWDPDELSNLADRQPDVAARLAAEIEAQLAISSIFEPETAPAEPISQEALEALRGLGYVE